MKSFRFFNINTNIFFYILILFCVFSCNKNTQTLPNALKEIETNDLEDITPDAGGTDLYAAPTEEGIISYQNEEELDSPELFYTVLQVQPGDQIGMLAQEYGVSQDSIISVNNIGNTRAIQIGDYFKIPSIDGIAYTVNKGDTLSGLATRFGIEVDAIEKTNRLESGAILHEGTRLFLPDAHLDPFMLAEINGDLFRNPLGGRRYHFSSYFGWRTDPLTRRRGWHGGLDMSTGSYNSPIYSAMGGTVIANGWSSVYGNYVKISHHSGYVTLYGHMNKKSSLKIGTFYPAGTYVGPVGSTGRSTGPHLHFGDRKSVV